MTRQEALAIYRRHGLLVAQFGVREDVAAKLAELSEQLMAAQLELGRLRDVAERARRQRCVGCFGCLLTDGWARGRTR